MHTWGLSWTVCAQAVWHSLHISSCTSSAVCPPLIRAGCCSFRPCCGCSSWPCSANHSMHFAGCRILCFPQCGQYHWYRFWPRRTALLSMSELSVRELADLRFCWTQCIWLSPFCVVLLAPHGLMQQIFSNSIISDFCTHTNWILLVGVLLFCLWQYCKSHGGFGISMNCGWHKSLLSRHKVCCPLMLLPPIRSQTSHHHYLGCTADVSSVSAYSTVFSFSYKHCCWDCCSAQVLFMLWLCRT